VVGFLREADAVLPVEELRRKRRFSEPSCCARKTKLVRMKVSGAQR
jgi:hypothetical protein